MQKLVIDLAEIAATARAMRRTGPTAIVHSGGKQTIFGCLCGARHTCATSYRQANHVIDWTRLHDDECWRLYERAQERKSPGWIDRARQAIYNRDL